MDLIQTHAKWMANENNPNPRHFQRFQNLASYSMCFWGTCPGKRGRMVTLMLRNIPETNQPLTAQHWHRRLLPYPYSKHLLTERFFSFLLTIAKQCPDTETFLCCMNLGSLLSELLITFWPIEFEDCGSSVNKRHLWDVSSAKTNGH